MEMELVLRDPVTKVTKPVAKRSRKIPNKDKKNINGEVIVVREPEISFVQNNRRNSGEPYGYIIFIPRALHNPDETIVTAHHRHEDKYYKVKLKKCVRDVPECLYYTYEVINE